MYTLVISKKESDNSVIELIEKKEGKNGPLRMFWFCYTAPYEKFEEIKKIQRIGAYKPFEENQSLNKVMAIELKEWIGHEMEDYFSVFLKFLHDSPWQHVYEYIFTVGETEYEEIESLHKVIKKYLGEGEVCFLEA